MEKLEKFILSIKYLPAILYFGSVGLLAYDFYCDISNETEFLNDIFKNSINYYLWLYDLFGCEKISIEINSCFLSHTSTRIFKACFQYLTSFDDLDGFTGVNRQMK